LRDLSFVANAEEDKLGAEVGGLAIQHTSPRLDAGWSPREFSLCVRVALASTPRASWNPDGPCQQATAIMAFDRLATRTSLQFWMIAVSPHAGWRRWLGASPSACAVQPSYKRRRATEHCASRTGLPKEVIERIVSPIALSLRNGHSEFDRAHSRKGRRK